MFKTLSIKNISNSYNKKVQQNNYDVAVKKYLDSFGLYNSRVIGKYEEEYKVCFLLKIENNYGEKEKIMFAYKHNSDYPYSKYNYRPDVIIGGNITNREPEQAIYNFCSKYGKYLLDGYDITDIAENDPENILNYKFEKKLSKVKNK